jgi:hypothetical protein
LGIPSVGKNFLTSSNYDEAERLAESSNHIQKYILVSIDFVMCRPAFIPVKSQLG